MELWASQISRERVEEGSGRSEIEFDHTANELINHSYTVKTPVKYLDTKTQKGFLVGQHINVLGWLFI